MALFPVAATALCCSLLPLSVAQQAGTSKAEAHIPINFWSCTKAGGCVVAQSSLTMDAQWRWTHNKQSQNCLTSKDAKWETADAPNGKAAAANCAIEGMPLNKEFTFDVDVSTLECGLNGAVYFVEMEANG